MGPRRGFWPIFTLDFCRLLESLACGRRHLRVLMHPLSFRLVPMNPVFCKDGFNCQSGKVKILETRHLAHGRVQAARRRRSTGTVFVSRRLLSRWTRWFWNTIMDQIDLSSTANVVNLYRLWQIFFQAAKPLQTNLRIFSQVLDLSKTFQLGVQDYAIVLIIAVILFENA